MTATTEAFSARIARLFIYPVKSCAGVEVTEAVLTPSGLDLDRAWMVVDADGEGVTQRELPRLALVRTQLKHHEVVLRAPGMLALHLAIDSVEGPVRVRVWDDEVAAYDMGNIAAQWFTDFLGTALRLVRFDPEHRRLSDPKWTDGAEATNQFNDGFPILVLGEASMAGLNERLVRAGHAAVGVDRFRPNLVLAGGQPHDEDRVAQLAIDGGAVLRLVKPCARCPIPNIDQATAESSPVVGDSLQGYRQDRRLNGAASFGMNAIVAQGEDLVLRVGQAVRGDWRFD